MKAKIAQQIKKPAWLKTPIPGGKIYSSIKLDLRNKKLSTVCEEAKCPNIRSCWSTNTATFMLMGDTCTRACRFCHIKTHSNPPLPDQNEAVNVAESCKSMDLKYVVMTMVDRDDLDDGGTGHITGVVKKVKELNPEIIIELLAGDFSGISYRVKEIIESNIHVYAHNIETVERLTPRVRDRRASYKQSLFTLKKAKELGGKKIFTKSSIMLGLGESYDEIITCLEDLRNNDVDFVTIGQYMRPTKRHLAVKDWVHPDIFKKIEIEAKGLGFLSVVSGPLVRSSYKASEFYQKAVEENKIG